MTKSSSSCGSLSREIPRGLMTPVAMCVMCNTGENNGMLAGARTGSYVGVSKPRADRLGLEWRGQSRASPTPHRRRGVPCERLIRDLAGLAALALVNQMAANRLGMEAGAPKATPQTHQLGGRHGKKNGEVNSPTPGNQCAGRPVTLSGECGPPWCSSPPPLRSLPFTQAHNSRGDDRRRLTVSPCALRSLLPWLPFQFAKQNMNFTGGRVHVLSRRSRTKPKC